VCAAQQVRSVQAIITELDAQSTPQILVLNKADAVAADPAVAARARDTPWDDLHPAVAPQTIVATSSRDGRGIDKLLRAVEEILLALSTRVECVRTRPTRPRLPSRRFSLPPLTHTAYALFGRCVLPYADAALLAEVHKSGTIETEEYVSDGKRRPDARPRVSDHAPAARRLSCHAGPLHVVPVTLYVLTPPPLTLARAC
jgi:hypothetical protein